LQRIVENDANSAEGDNAEGNTKDATDSE